jgi:hypothetical protein
MITFFPEPKLTIGIGRPAKLFVKTPSGVLQRLFCNKKLVRVLKV